MPSLKNMASIGSARSVPISPMVPSRLQSNAMNKKESRLGL